MSIKLILENIGCHSHSEFNFERGTLSLIKGPNGKGKSTIFRALTWAIHGNIKGICSFGATKYSVTLILPEIKVIRNSKSPKLEVIYQGIYYDNKEVCQDI